jgi:hypothetical protein
MKKTLVALAVLAASGASFAQVTLSGEFAYGFLATTNGTGANASGLGIDTGLLVFSAKEDLGQGYMADVTMKTDSSGGRSAAINSDDQIIGLTTPFGRLTMGSWKPAEFISSVSGRDTWYGLDNRVTSARTTRDSIGFAAPITSTLTASATYYEPANAIGEGSGTAGTSAQQSNVYTLSYNGGALKGALSYVSYNNVGSTDSTVKSVTRGGANYDLGMVKVGAGLQVASHAGSGTNTQYMVSLSAPIGSKVSVNAAWAGNNVDVSATSTLAASNGTRTGYMLGAQYNMSKRTYAILNYGNWLGNSGTGTAADAQNSNLTAMTLVHDF